MHLFFPHVFTVKQLQNAFLALTDAFFTPSTISLGFLRIDLLSFSFFWISYNFVTKWHGTLKVSPVALMVIFGLIALAVFSLGLGSLVNKFQIFFTSHFWCILLKLIFQEHFNFENFFIPFKILKNKYKIKYVLKWNRKINCCKLFTWNYLFLYFNYNILHEMIKSESSISISATFNNQNEGRGGRIIVFVLNLSIAKLNTSNYLFRDLKLCT